MIYIVDLCLLLFSTINIGHAIFFIFVDHFSFFSSFFIVPQQLDKSVKPAGKIEKHLPIQDRRILAVFKF
jgi:hypothetical protein